MFIPTSNVTGWAIETLDWNSETDGGIFKSTIIYYNYMIGLHSSHIIELCSGQYCIPGGSIFTHELMHEGGAIGESYGENPQMWTNASVQNVINWINRR